MSSSHSNPYSSSETSRRGFLKASAAIGAATAFGHLPFGVYAGGREVIRVGLIGCGGRGTGAAFDCLNADEAVRITAMGDLFADRLAGSRKNLEKKKGDRVEVSDETCFVGFDAYEKVLAADVDLVILATPPGFRPQHLAAAIDAGKHVFAEKPVAVDPVGIRTVIGAADAAKQKGLAIVAGTQRRHQESYLETMRRIQDGAIGEVLSGSCYWNQKGLWVHERKPDYSDMEWQVRNWLYFTWLSGDHVVEQHVHNIDVMNWVMGAHPEKALGVGGRQSRTDPKYGQIFDHFAIEFTYPGGRRVLSMCRQMEGCPSRVDEVVVGSAGSAHPGGRIDGKEGWRYRNREAPNPYVQEHVDLIASIRSGKPLNEGRRIAESTLCAIMARMAAYTGQEIAWDWAIKESQLDLVPENPEFGPLPVAEVAQPGKTPLV